MNKTRAVKILGLVAAIASAAALAVTGNYTEAAGILAASFSSANIQ